MENKLRDVLTERAVSAAPTAPTGLPAPVPSKPARVPPALDRYKTALRMQRAYANGWEPNPILIRIFGEK